MPPFKVVSADSSRAAGEGRHAPRAQRWRLIVKYSMECAGVEDSPNAVQTTIATGLVAPAVSPVGHSVESGVGPRWLAQVAAHSIGVHTRHFVDRQVVAVKNVGVALAGVDVGLSGLVRDEPGLRQSAVTGNPLGISGCLLRAHCCGSFHLP